MPRDKLLGYLSGITSSDLHPNLTPGMDNSVVALKYPGLYLISTVDFFFPLVEDPYLQVRQGLVRFGMFLFVLQSMCSTSCRGALQPATSSLTCLQMLLLKLTRSL